jgi:hypothetical protein
LTTSKIASSTTTAFARPHDFSTLTARSSSRNSRCSNNSTSTTRSPMPCPRPCVGRRVQSTHARGRPKVTNRRANFDLAAKFPRVPARFGGGIAARFGPRRLPHSTTRRRSPRSHHARPRRPHPTHHSRSPRSYHASPRSHTPLLAQHWQPAVYQAAPPALDAQLPLCFPWLCQARRDCLAS